MPATRSDEPTLTHTHAHKTSWTRKCVCGCECVCVGRVCSRESVGISADRVKHAAEYSQFGKVLRALSQYYTDKLVYFYVPLMGNLNISFISMTSTYSTSPIHFVVATILETASIAGSYFYIYGSTMDAYKCAEPNHSSAPPFTHTKSPSVHTYTPTVWQAARMHAEH